MPSNENKKLYLVKGKNNLYHPKLLTNNELYNVNGNETVKKKIKNNIYKTENGKPYELKKIIKKTNKIFKKLQFKIKNANSTNNEWQNIYINQLGELGELKIKVNGKNIYLKDIFPTNQDTSNLTLNSTLLNYSNIYKSNNIFESNNPLFKKQLRVPSDNNNKNQNNILKQKLISIQNKDVSNNMSPPYELPN